MTFPYKVKSEIIEETAEKVPHINPIQVENAVKNIIELITLSLVSGNAIEIRGFGRFMLCWYKGRKAHNPKTGEPVFTTDTCRPRFKTGKLLKERVTKNAKESEAA